MDNVLLFSLKFVERDTWVLKFQLLKVQTVPQHCIFIQHTNMVPSWAVTNYDITNSDKTLVFIKFLVNLYITDVVKKTNAHSNNSKKKFNKLNFKVVLFCKDILLLNDKIKLWKVCTFTLYWKKK